MKNSGTYFLRAALTILCSCVLALASFSQVKNKALIIPFEPRMYMSQVDHRINAETKLTQKQIREIFRKGVNEEMARALKKNMDVLDLMKDTAKFAKDIFSIYKNITYSFDKVPDQSNYKAPVSEKDSKKNQNIKNGQLVVETDPEARFMNTKVKNPTLIPGLYAKYKTNLFVFINQIDINSTAVAANEMGGISDRMLVLHYTIYTIDAKEINSGICNLIFPGDVNTPSKIISSYVSKIAAEISRRVELALAKMKEKENSGKK